MRLVQVKHHALRDHGLEENVESGGRVFTLGQGIHELLLEGATSTCEQTCDEVGEPGDNVRIEDHLIGDAEGVRVFHDEVLIHASVKDLEARR